MKTQVLGKSDLAITPIGFGAWAVGGDWQFGWGEQVHIFSHACVTAHLGLAHAARLLHAGLADRVLVFSFDFVSPFVAGGFHSLKILNGTLPAPFARRETGSIGLGDGAAFAVLGREAAPFRLAAHALYNEMFHFTANQPDAAGFATCAASIAAAAGGRRVWVKGHGTGTLEVQNNCNLSIRHVGGAGDGLIRHSSNCCIETIWVGFTSAFRRLAEA